MAGGTGGHIFPAMSIAEKLLQRGALVEWLGAYGGLENDIVSKTSIPLHLISVHGVSWPWLGKSYCGAIYDH